MPADDQLEAVREARILVLTLGKRRDLLRVVTHEGGVHERGLAKLVIERKQQLSRTPTLLPLDVVRLAQLTQTPDGRIHIDALADTLRHYLDERARGPATAHVYRLALVADELAALLTAADTARDGLEEPLAEPLHALEIGVGAVGLHRGELGVMRKVHALVAKLPSELEDTLHASHDEALERQLGGYAQIEVAIKRIEVRRERLGVGTSQDGVHHGRLDLEVTRRLHVAADEANDG